MLTDNALCMSLVVSFFFHLHIHANVNEITQVHYFHLATADIVAFVSQIIQQLQKQYEIVAIVKKLPNQRLYDFNYTTYSSSIS